jgi:hypothetical protein
MRLPPANAEAGPGQARIESYRDDSVVVRTAADASGVLVLTDTFYPGWAAEIDGRPTPILRTDYLFRGVVVPAGEHVVTFAFRPWSVMIGAVISLLTTCFVLVMALVPLLVALGRRVRLTRPAGLSVRGAPQPAGSMAEVP